MLVSVLVAALAAQSEPSVDEQPWSLNAEAGMVSDYSYRGVSLSGGKPALQGSISLEHRSGFYVDLWSSTLSRSVSGSKAEVDSSVGFSADLSSQISIDTFATAYLYPKNSELNYGELTVRVEHKLGPALASAEASYAPPQRATVDQNGQRSSNLYLSVGTHVPIPRTRLTILGGVGRETGAYDMTDAGPKRDWKIGLQLDTNSMRAEVNLVGSSIQSSGDQTPSLAAGLFLSL